MIAVPGEDVVGFSRNVEKKIEHFGQTTFLCQDAWILFYAFFIFEIDGQFLVFRMSGDSAAPSTSTLDKQADHLTRISNRRQVKVSQDAIQRAMKAPEKVGLFIYKL